MYRRSGHFSDVTHLSAWVTGPGPFYFSCMAYFGAPAEWPSTVMKLRNPTHRAPARPQPNLHHDGGPRAAARLGFKATHIIVTGKAAARSRRHRSRARGEGAQWGRLVSFVLGAQPARGARLGETAKRVSQRGYPTKVASREKIGHQAATGRNSGGQFASPRRVAAERSALEWLSLCSRATSSRRVGELMDCRYGLPL